MTHRTPTLPIGRLAGVTAAGTLALGLAAGPAAAQTAQTGSAEAEAGETAYGQTDGEMSPLQEAVRARLAEIGVTSVGLRKYSSEQLAAILLTLTNQSAQGDGIGEQLARENGIDTVLQGADGHAGPTTAEDVAGNQDIRAAIADALGRAGWTADVSQLTDRQVAALFDVLADAGNLETRRIEEVLP